MFYSYVYQKVEQTTITTSELPPEPRNLKKRKDKQALSSEIEPGHPVAQGAGSNGKGSVITQRLLDKSNTSSRVKTAKAANAKSEERLVKDILPVVDALDRAVDYVKGESTEGQLQGVLNGLRLVQKMFLNQLEKNEIVSFDSEGEIFDPSQHEAIESRHSENIQAGNVVNEYQRGFFMNGNLLRPSLVTVSLGTKDKQEQTSD